MKSRGFLPYRLRMTLEATALQPGRVVEVRAYGDLEGVWRATLTKDGDGTRVAIDENVLPKNP